MARVGPMIATPGGGGKQLDRPVRKLALAVLRSRAALSCAALALLRPTSASATSVTELIAPAGINLGAVEVIQGAVFLGITGAAFVSATWLIRERARIAHDNLEMSGRLAELNTAVQRSETLLNLKDQRLVVWTKDAPKPDVVGTLGLTAGAPEERAAFLAFGRWLSARSASTLEKAIAALRDKSQAFEIVVETQAGALLEVHGRVSGASAVARFLSLSQAQNEHARLKADYATLAREHDVVRGLLESLQMPFWLRDQTGALRWVNTAYAIAADARDSSQAVAENREILPTAAREAISAHLSEQADFSQTVSTVIAGDRKMLAVSSHLGDGLVAGIARDDTETETVREAMRKLQRSHSETLDQLTTAVASFDSNEKLRFYNQAFQKLWDLDVGFLESAPGNATLLDRLRADGKLEEQPEWRKWKENTLAAYRLVDAREDWWHLPDGRTLRVLANPNPTGGVTWVFENLTEKMDLESRYNAAVRVQRETLDNLAEGVAVFGPDGKLRLSNPAFAALWSLDAELAKPGTHIAAIRAACDLFAKESPWPRFVSDVTGFADERVDRHGEAELADGSVLRYALIQLPNGQVMITFVDVTDTANVQRALKDKNDALQAADQLKNDFVQHVSYELRSPLTNIIGFTELMAQPEIGPLTERQRDYLDHIGSSSAVLLTIVNDILDLATVDAGIMELDVEEVDVDRLVKETIELVGDRVRKHSIVMDVDLSSAPTRVRADEGRLRQILFNLLSNAVNYAPDASTVSIVVRGGQGGFELSVSDQGPGMAPEVLDTVYRRFESRANGGRKRGAGLGLSVVKTFVELHGGEVRIETAPNRGTTVTCTFPSEPAVVAPAAE